LEDDLGFFYPERPAEVGVPVFGLGLGRVGGDGVDVDVDRGDVVAGRGYCAVPGDSGFFFQFA
jgi:hypothetical protein